MRGEAPSATGRRGDYATTSAATGGAEERSKRPT